METTKLSSKGQVIIPKAFRSTHHWEPGLELMVIDTGSEQSEPHALRDRGRFHS